MKRVEFSMKSIEKQLNIIQRFFNRWKIIERLKIFNRFFKSEQGHEKGHEYGHEYYQQFDSCHFRKGVT